MTSSHAGEISRKRVLLRIEGVDVVDVRRDLACPGGDGEPLGLHLYRSSTAAAARLGSKDPRALPGEAGVLVAPNPFGGHGLLSVALPRPVQARVSILDLNGAVIWAQDLGALPAGVNDRPLDLRAKANGLYFVVLETSGGEGWRPAARFKLALAR